MHKLALTSSADSSVTSQLWMAIANVTSTIGPMVSTRRSVSRLFLDERSVEVNTSYINPYNSG